MDGWSTIIGAVGGAAVAILGAWRLFYALRSKETREDRQTSQGLALQQYDNLFVQYQVLLKAHKKDNDELNEQMEMLKASTSAEIHQLRDNLQATLLAKTILEEQIKYLKPLACVREDCHERIPPSPEPAEGKKP